MKNEIPLETLDKRVTPNKYVLIKTGGYHPFYNIKELEEGDEHYRKPIWPWIKKISGNLQHKKQYGKVNGSVSPKKPYVNYTVEKTTLDKHGRPDRLKIYFHIAVAKAFCNPKKLIHEQDGGSYNIDHINDKPVDYRPENLRFVTKSENSIGYPQSIRVDRETIYKIHKKARYA